MCKKRRVHNRFSRHKKVLALALSLMLISSLLPVYVFAADSNPSNIYLCGHVHDDACGYDEGAPEASCNHICEVVGFNKYVPGEAISTYEAKADETYDEICAALPQTLAGKLACAGNDVALPVRWVCDNFTGDAGTYTFSAQLTNIHCSYTAANGLPFITVTVPESTATDEETAPEQAGTPETGMPDGTTAPLEPTPAPDSTTGLEPTPAPDLATESDPAPTVYTLSHDKYPVTVSGTDPQLDGARLVVEKVDLLDAQELLEGINSTALFAYDIKIMTGGTLDEATGEYLGETEFQPAADNPVTVSITPTTPTDAPLEVVHITENKATGETTPQTVQNVVTTAEGAIEFEAKGFSIYIGTTGNGTGITLTPGSGYTFYSDDLCVTEIPSGAYVPATLPNSIYLKANDNYSIDSVSIKNEGGTVSAATAVESNGIWTLTFPGGLTENQIITVTTYVHAYGGTIRPSSTATEVATMFDATATSAETDNVLVSVNGGSFTVEVKNNILLKNTITVASSANITLTTSGDLTVKRDPNPLACTDVMFVVNGTLSLGTGTGSGGTVTYLYSDDTPSDPLAPDAEMPTPPGNAHIVDVIVTKDHSSTTAGTLTIDGGAVFTTPIDAATKTTPVCSTPTTGSIIESSGTFILWDRVTLQNNFTNLTTSDDEDTDAGVRIIDGEFYMYGGKITQCSTYYGASWSDGGGVCFTDGDAFFYGGEITQCCADNGSAVAIFGYSTKTPTAYYLGTSIHDNLASSDPSYPGQACSAYNGGAIRMFAGDIINNKNTFDDSSADVNYDMKPSGSNSGVYLFGGTIGKLGVVYGATVRVYGCEITTINGIGTVLYERGYAVTVPNCVALTTSDEVTVSIKKKNGSIYEDYITIVRKGDGLSPNLDVDLLAGNYRITVDSSSMQKEYTAVVTNDAVMATPVSRHMTVPSVMWQTSNSINLIPAGTNNAAIDGEIFYGFSDTDNADSVPALNSGQIGAWQSSPTFDTSGLNDTRYFFIKADAPSSNPNNFQDSTSSSLAVDFSIEPSVTIIRSFDPEPLAVGKTYTLGIVKTPLLYNPANIQWSISGNNSAETKLSPREDGRGSLTIAATETALTFTVTVELLDKDMIPTGVSDSLTIQTTPLAYIEYSSLEAPAQLTAQIMLGSGGIYEYRWECTDNGSGTYSTIPNETSNTYSATYSDIGKHVRVVITDGSSTYVSAGVLILPPTLSVTLPVTTAVTMDATGQCTVSGGQIENSSAVPVYVTDVSYEWATAGERDANELFHDYRLVTATLTLNGTAYNFSGATPPAASPSSVAGVVDAIHGTTPGSLLLQWTFNLGTGNYLNLAPAVGDPTQVATVIYTISYLPPATS